MLAFAGALRFGLDCARGSRCVSAPGFLERPDAPAFGRVAPLRGLAARGSHPSVGTGVGGTGPRRAGPTPGIRLGTRAPNCLGVAGSDRGPTTRKPPATGKAPISGAKRPGRRGGSTRVVWHGRSSMRVRVTRSGGGQNTSTAYFYWTGSEAARYGTATFDGFPPLGGSPRRTAITGGISPPAAGTDPLT